MGMSEDQVLKCIVCGAGKVPSKNKKVSFLKYRFGLKKDFVKDPDGQVAFILLRKLD